MIAKSVAAIDQLIDNAPTVPERPVLVEEVPEEAAEEVVESSQSIPEKEENNSIPTRISVSYRAFDTVPEKETVKLASHKEELASQEATEGSRPS